MTECSTLTTGTTQECSFSPIQQRNKARKRNKRHTDWGGREKIAPIHHRCEYLYGTYQRIYKNLSELISEFSKAAGHKSQHTKVTFLYTSNEQLYSKIFKNTIYYLPHQKILGINVTKHMQDRSCKSLFHSPAKCHLIGLENCQSLSQEDGRTGEEGGGVKGWRIWASSPPRHLASGCLNRTALNSQGNTKIHLLKILALLTDEETETQRHQATCHGQTFHKRQGSWLKVHDGTTLLQGFSGSRPSIPQCYHVLLCTGLQAASLHSQSLVQILPFWIDLVKSRYWFNKSRMGLRLHISNKLQGGTYHHMVGFADHCLEQWDEVFPWEHSFRKSA